MAEDDAKTTDQTLTLLKSMHDDVRLSLKEGRKTKECVNALQKDFALHQQKTDLTLEQHGELLEKHNKILEEHSTRSAALQEQNENFRKEYKAEVFSEGITDPDKRKKTLIGRVESLELGKKYWKWLGCAIILGASIIKALDVWLNFL